MNSNRVGDVAETAIAYEATKAGLDVYVPLSGHSRCDLVFGLDDRLFRVQVKSAKRSGEVVVINLVTNWHTPNDGYARRRYLSGELDLVAAYCAELDTRYLIPHDRVAGATGIRLRLSPPKNAQRASIHYADEFLFPGAVAQLARATRWQRVGRGFESRQLHSAEPGTVTVGSQRFHKHFGYYMERAERGEEITVTRRGKPIARLTSYQPELSPG